MSRRRAERWVWLVALVALLAWSARGAGVQPGLLFGADGRAQIGSFIGGMFPPDLSPEMFSGLLGPVIETLQMSLLGVVFGALVAAPLAVLATRTPGELTASARGVGRIRVQAAVYSAARSVLNLMRTIPDLVWALMFVAAVGLGPFAGVLALTVHSAGLLGKLYAEAMESVDRGAAESLNVLGAGRTTVLLFAVLPQAAAPLVSVTLYQWECNIRSAMVLGFVGAGGLGQRIDLAMRLFRYDEMLTLLAVLLLLVTLVDRLSAFVRSRLALRG